MMCQTLICYDLSYRVCCIRCGSIVDIVSANYGIQHTQKGNNEHHISSSLYYLHMFHCVQLRTNCITRQNVCNFKLPFYTYLVAQMRWRKNHQSTNIMPHRLFLKLECILFQGYIAYTIKANGYHSGF